MLNRDNLLGFKTRRQNVNVPALGGDVVARELLSAEVVEYGSRQQQGGAKAAVAYVVATAALNEDGTQMFHDGDLVALGELPYAVTGPIVEAVMSLSGLTPPAAPKA